jgi:site-specific DNA-adenine methylase
VETEIRSDAPEGFFLTNVPFEGIQKKTFETEYELLNIIGKGKKIFLKFCTSHLSSIVNNQISVKVHFSDPRYISENLSFCQYKQQPFSL